MKMLVHVPPMDESEIIREKIIDKISKTFDHTEDKNSHPTETIFVSLEKSHGVFNWTFAYHYNNLHLYLHKKGTKALTTGIQGVTSLQKLFHTAIKKQRNLNFAL